MLVVIESPYAGDVERNRKYLQRCIKDSLDRGEFPFASHQMYTDALDDTNPEDREKGIRGGFEWGSCANEVIFFVDYGMSPGMHKALDHWLSQGKKITFLKILTEVRKGE